MYGDGDDGAKAGGGVVDEGAVEHFDGAFAGSGVELEAEGAGIGGENGEDAGEGGVLYVAGGEDGERGVGAGVAEGDFDDAVGADEFLAGFEELEVLDGGGAEEEQAEGVVGGGGFEAIVGEFLE